MLTLFELKKLQKEYGFSYDEIAKKSGVPLTTVQKIFGGFTASPRRKTLDKLEKAFADVSSEWKLGSAMTGRSASGTVGETEYKYRTSDIDVRRAAERLLDAKKQGEFTVDDYHVISDVWRIELIDGVIYDMTSPAVDHQHLVGGIYAQLLACADRRGDGCMPLISPIDVQLDCDDKTMVQPDVIVTCDKKKVRKRVIFGAPDLAVEVMSPSSRMKDRVTKRDKYRDAGCREYWIVDPAEERVKVYGFESGVDGLYTFEQKVPVGISGGECEVDFSAIKKRIDLMTSSGLY